MCVWRVVFCLPFVCLSSPWDRQMREAVAELGWAQQNLQALPAANIAIFALPTQPPDSSLAITCPATRPSMLYVFKKCPAANDYSGFSLQWYHRYIGNDSLYRVLTNWLLTNLVSTVNIVVLRVIAFIEYRYNKNPLCFASLTKPRSRHYTFILPNPLIQYILLIRRRLFFSFEGWPGINYRLFFFHFLVHWNL